MSFRIFTLNIEGDKHLDRFLPVAVAKKPHVVFLQEVFEVNMPVIQEKLGMKGWFYPMVRIEDEHRYGIAPLGAMGLGVFSNLPIQVSDYYYVGQSSEISIFTEPNSLNRVVACATIDDYKLATTHFTWSPKGQFTKEQERDWQNLKSHLDTLGEYVLCGDFNAPRGGEMYQVLTTDLKDWVPPEIKSTLDHRWHYAGKLDLVVDYFLSTSGYKVESVEAISNVSDHKALIGEVVRLF